MSTKQPEDGTHPAEDHGHSPCGECPLAVDRRSFLRDTALAALAALAGLTTVAVSPALAHAVRTVRPVRAAGPERLYQIPAADSVSIDEENEVILVRWQKRAYAFSSRCTHRGAPLQWRENEGRVFCPKHKARFRPDGAHDSGRPARDLDRYGIRRRGDALAIDLAVLYRADDDLTAWSQAFVALA
jgi:nitrite reductase/ring-hydroxylating ferredoxin subunit